MRASRLSPGDIVKILGAIIGLVGAVLSSIILVKCDGDPPPPIAVDLPGPTWPPPGPTAPRTGTPAGSSASFDVDRHYGIKFMGDIGDIGKQEFDDAVRFTYTARGEGPHEWDYKFADGELNPRPCKFAGMMFVDGDWGKDAPGYDLRGRGVVEWEARSVGGPVLVEFVAGGVVWAWDEKAKEKVKPQYPDSLPHTVLGKPRLTDTWQTFRHRFDSPDDNLRAVVGSFGWVITWDSNDVREGQPRTLVTEVRNVRYERS